MVMEVPEEPGVEMMEEEAAVFTEEEAAQEIVLVEAVLVIQSVRYFPTLVEYG